MFSYFLLLLIVLISICELIGQSCLKYLHINSEEYHYFLYAVIFYGFVCFLLLQSYKYKGMGIINVLWSGISILVIIFASVMMFNEQITLYDKIGILFVIIGMFLILFEDKQHPMESFIEKI